MTSLATSPKTLRLCQVLATIAGLAKASKDTMTEADKAMKSAGDQLGHRKKYQPKDEDGERIPDSVQAVKARALDLIGSVADKLRPYVNAASARDATNTRAKADVIVDGVILFENVPVPQLLFLENILVDIQTWLERANVRDSSEAWTWNADERLWQSAPVETQKNTSKKRPIVLYNATDKHPAQVQLIDEQMIAGVYETVHFSGALPGAERDRLVKKVADLLMAVRHAREEANMLEIVEPKLGDKLVSYLFSETLGK